MYRISESVRSTHGQDGAIVLDIKQGQMFNVNLAGSRILQLLAAETPESVITDEISRDFGVSRDVVSRDVHQFIRVLEEHRLIENRNWVNP